MVMRGLRVHFALAILFALFALPLETACDAAPQKMFSDAHQAMGTAFTIYLYAADRERASELFNAAFDEIDRLDDELSNYKPQSEISRINRLAAKETVTTDPEVLEFLRRSFEFSRRTDGAFDITVGPLMRAWGFFRGQGRYPTARQLAQARKQIGWQFVQLNTVARTVHFTKPGIELDPGGIGKGFAVDRVAGVLREDEVTATLIDAGSSTLYAIGAPPGKEGWPVLVHRPENSAQTISTVLLRDNSLSTSGSYEKLFRLGNRVYCHIMNPRTGEPVQEMLQTTVIASSGTDSDALSTSAFVLGPERGKRLLSSFEGASVVWVLGEPKNEQTVAWRWPVPVEGAANSAVIPAVSHEFDKPQGRLEQP